MMIKLTKSQMNLLNIGSKLHTSDGYDYYYIPFYFKSTDKPNVFEQYSLEKLPTELLYLIDTKRNEHKI